ncbi:MAG: hypothetical protein ACP5VS_12540 [Desulfomonilaceae bacterium]
MKSDIEQKILERIDNPGWVTTRGIILDPSGPANFEEYRAIEAAMRSLSDKGMVVLWRLIIEANGAELMAAARPGLELDKDLERRGAWAKAVIY